MLVSEEEAKKKTCHKTVAPMKIEHGDGRDFFPQPCLGSGCMAWRWLYHDLKDLSRPHPGYPSLGYCGLAGDPAS